MATDDAAPLPPALLSMQDAGLSHLDALVASLAAMELPPPDAAAQSDGGVLPALDSCTEEQLLAAGLPPAVRDAINHVARAEAAVAAAAAHVQRTQAAGANTEYKAATRARLAVLAEKAFVVLTKLRELAVNAHAERDRVEWLWVRACVTPPRAVLLAIQAEFARACRTAITLPRRGTAAINMEGHVAGCDCDSCLLPPHRLLAADARDGTITAAEHTGAHYLGVGCDTCVACTPEHKAEWTREVHNEHVRATRVAQAAAREELAVEMQEGAHAHLEA